jgi:hypothetical protein
MEHVGYPLTGIKNVLLSAYQLLIEAILHPLMGGCHLYRHSWSYIENAGFKSLELNLEYPKEMALGLKPTIWGTARM